MIPIPALPAALRGIGLRGAAMAALGLGFAVQTVRIEGLKIWPIQIEGFAAANKRLQFDIDAFRQAQKDAAQKQASQERGEIAEKTGLAETFHDHDKETRAAVATAVARYARNHNVLLPVGLPCAKADAGSPGRAGTTGLPGDPGQPAGPDAAAGMVAITRADLNHLSEGAVQGAVKTRFLNALVDAGWAIPLSKVEMPEPAFGKEEAK